MSSVLFSGDWHAGTEHAVRTIELAGRSGIKRVVQVGDFGYWPRVQAGRQFLEAVSAVADRTDVTVWFCDGNHEDHDSLPHATATAPVEVSPRVFWVPRGTTVEWDDRRLLFFGGAVSIDQDSRISGWTWFSNEIPNDEAWHRAETSAPIDIVVAHDTVPEMPVRGLPPLAVPWSARRRALDHRKRLRSLAHALRPTWWIHGHWHNRATARLSGIRFESLGHDRGDFDASYLPIDLTSLEPSHVDA